MSMVKTVVDKNTDKKWWEQKAATTKDTETQKHTKSIQTLTFNTSSFDDEERTFVAIASTPVVDRYGDTIQQEGWNLDNFLKNPVVPWAHDYWQPPVARVTEIGINEQGNLQFKYQAPPKGIYPFADTIWELYRNQFMFAFSVGFNSILAEGDWHDGFDFKECELLEISAVVVPANPQAVALALDKGFIDQEQLKDLKTQLADGIKNVDRLIDNQTDPTKQKAAKKPETKTTDKVETKVNLDATEVKSLVESINKASDRLETAIKASHQNVGKPTEEDTESKSLTTGAAVDDTKGMETKAGASLSKANKDKLKSVNSDLADFIEKCQTHMAALSAMMGDEDSKATEDGKTKAADQKVEKKDAQDEKTEGQEETAKTTEATEESKDGVQQGDDDAAKGDGEVNSDEAATTAKDEGADQKTEGEQATEVEKTDEEEIVDPENLTPEQAEKIAAAVNEELDKLKQ